MESKTASACTILLSSHSAVQVEHQSHDDSVTLTNGLISRTFRLYPDFGTVDFRSEVKGKSLLRAINPEARVTLDGFEYAIGGLQANVKHDFLNRSAVEYTLDPNAFHLQCKNLLFFSSICNCCISIR